ncbi:LysR family transcriptional regulator [Chromobacterium subtsugae]|uniref:LysR family transcriptional regulator n=1 Tax=Chromobacterium subtsugae TaxID=251747 RepID=A0ABS7FIY4_9NEIS|nr:MULTISPECIES: LysR family transcriptional regulator [Chromobacterium]MBW7568965.1 LysR family transcriptional regulator [Chromobacterium subtsugae]MBW8290022.1 LysR family transcriptional regulator [Chromobacterium subtsugae]WSE92967.1 LysR family transcriptional regulator [Chromobacterium subtsugae]WVH61345.1 LysR family transcriptional regulator [Chromobacterium subtsugae]
MLDSSMLGALRSFEAAGRLLSFTRAAQELHLTQSAVSQQVRKLEERLGYRLFARGSALGLTDKGGALLRTVSAALGEIEQTLARLGADAAPLQLSCVPSFALRWLMPRLTEFQRLAPEVPLRLLAEFQPPDGGMAGADIAIRYDAASHVPPQAVPLLDEYLLPVATPAYLARHPAFAAGESMDGIAMLHDASPWDGAEAFAEWRLWLQAARPDWLPLLGGAQFNLSSLALGMALNHEGVAMARTALVWDELQSGRLVDVFGRWVASPARYALLGRDPSRRETQAFAGWISSACARFDAERERVRVQGAGPRRRQAG